MYCVLFLSVTKSRGIVENEKMGLGLLGKLVQSFYAIPCLGVALVSITVAHNVYAVETEDDPNELAEWLLRALQGPVLHPN